MKLNDFSGGLSLRLDPSLIQLNEAVVYTNVDNAKGTLQSIKNYTSLITSVGIWFHKFKGSWYSSYLPRDYVEYRNKLYYTEENNKPRKVVPVQQEDGTTVYVNKLLGIEQPAAALTLAAVEPGTIIGESFEEPGVPSSISVNPQGTHVAVGASTNPYLTIYTVGINQLIKLDGLAGMPTRAVTAVSYSQDGGYLCVGLAAAPYAIIYKVSGESYTKLTNPSTMPTGMANNISWSNDNLYLAIAHNTAPYISIYSIVGDTFTKIANPATLPTGNATDCEFSASSVFLYVTHANSPYVSIYKKSGSVFAKLPNPAALPSTECNNVVVSNTDEYVTVSFNSAPYLLTYKKAGDVFTKLPDPTIAIAGNITDLAYDSTSTYLLLSTLASPGLYAVKRTGELMTQLSEVESLGEGCTSLSYFPGSLHSIVTTNTSPYVYRYKRVEDAFEKFSFASTVQYMYTYYDSAEGIESAPSPLSEELELNAGYSVDITNFVPSENSAVDKIRLYRIGAYATDFTLLIELPIATTEYNDNIKTVDAIGSLLDSYFNNAPVSGLQYLVEAYGILFACKGDTLYYTEVGKPDAWSSVNVIYLPADITGLAPIAEGLIIHTIDKTSVLLGTAPETFRLVTISKEHGCLNHRSIQYVSNTLVWEAADGICAYSSGSISVITRDKLDRQVFNSRTSTVYNGQYFLALLDGSVFVMDTRFNTTYKTIKFEGKSILNVKAFDNKLYAVIDGELSELFVGDVLDLHYVSPEFTEGDAAVTKLYNNIYVRANGRFSFSVLIDGVVVLVTELLGNKVFDIKVPQEKQRGSSIQFDIFGHGVIKEIEWKVQGRENGR